MKKNHLILVAGLFCLLLVGCGTKTTPTDTIDTGMLFSGEQTLTGMQSGENVGDQNAAMREELTGENSNGSLTITGKDTVTITTGRTTSADIATLKKNLTTPSKTGTALTEEDVDNIDEAIQFVKDLFK